MIIDIDAHTTVDTARDMGPAERHVVQKLMAWKTLVTSLDQFRQKRAEALAAGWNGSGPVRETRALALVCGRLEKDVKERLIKEEAP